MYGSDKEALEALNQKHHALLAEIGKVIVGQEHVIREVTTAVFAGGHVLLVGVPGLAKTLLGQHHRSGLGPQLQPRAVYTPDLMPSDIVGSEILDEARHFKFMKGPLFANIVLADEINRTPPKTQSALLEAMQERAVTVAGQTYPLPCSVFRARDPESRLSKKAPTPCPKPSSTDSCSTPGSTTQPTRRS